MRRIVLVPLMCFLVSVVSMTGCSGKYGDAKALNEEFASLTETYVNDMEKCDSAKDVAKAMNKYADEMEKLMPKMKKVAEKYPELKNAKEMPEDMKDSQKKAEEMAGKMGSAFMKVAPHMSDPEVKKAQQRLSSVMTGM